MSLDLSGRKSGEQGSRIRPNFPDRNWQDGPVVRAGRAPQPESLQVTVTDCLLAATGRPSRTETLQDGTVAGRCFSRPTHTDWHKEIRMDDEIEIDIQDLDAYEIRELLLDQGSEVDEEQAAAIRQFIEDIGGLENALAAVDMLDGLEKAA
jgi:hypothetical protein